LVERTGAATLGRDQAVAGGQDEGPFGGTEEDRLVMLEIDTFQALGLGLVIDQGNGDDGNGYRRGRQDGTVRRAGFRFRHEWMQ